MPTAETLNSFSAVGFFFRGSLVIIIRSRDITVSKESVSIVASFETLLL